MPQCYGFTGEKSLGRKESDSLTLAVFFLSLTWVCSRHTFLFPCNLADCLFNSFFAVFQSNWPKGGKQSLSACYFRVLLIIKVSGYLSYAALFPF